MAVLKKNQLNQIMFVMVDKTDFATIESALGTDSDFNSKATKKFYGVNHGGSVAFTSGTISKLATTVRSGLYALTLKATEANYDFLTVLIQHPSCAVQAMTYQLVDNDDSDIRSAIAAVTVTVDASAASDIASAVWAHTIGTRVDSRVLLNLSRVSDAHSAAAQGNSRILLVQSTVSDVASAQVTLASDLRSVMIVVQSMISDVDSALTSQASNLLSLLGTTGVALNASAMSDLRSAIAAGPTAVVTASDISDIASAVRAILVSDLSDILSSARANNSRILLVQSSVSDANSMLTYLSSANSDLYSLLGAHISDFQSRVTGTVATASDVASRVWAEKYTAAGNLLPSTFGSLVHINMSRISDVYSLVGEGKAFSSDVYSQLSDFRSDLHSLLSTTGIRVDGSTVSDVASAVWAHATANALNSRVILIQSTASDAASAAQQGNSRALVAQSLLSDIYSNLVAGVLVGPSGLSDIGSRVWADPIGVTVSSRILVIKSAASDAASGVSDLRSLISNTGVKIGASDMSDLRSAITGGPAATVTASDISDIASAVWANITGAATASRVLLITSRVSDVYSLLSDVASAGIPLPAAQLSDLKSAIAAGPTGALTVSNISDIASRVVSALASDISDTLSAARQGVSQTVLTKSLASDAASAAAQANSRALLIQSMVSDIDSAADSQYAAGQILTVSALSDIGSRVWADTIGARVDSRLRLVQSTASDAASAAAQANSRVLLVQSLASDIDSALTSQSSNLLSQLQVMQSMASDAHSAAAQANSRVLLQQSVLSDVQSALVTVKAQTDNLPSAVKKNTQLANFKFLLISSTDHISPITGRTVTATRAIDGGAFAACANGVVEVSNGIYRITFAATDLNGDVITFRFNATGADDRFITICTKA